MRRNGRFATAAIVGLLVTGFGAGTAVGQFQVALPQNTPIEQEFVPGEILVKFKDNVPVAAADFVHIALGGKVIYESPHAGFQRVKVPAGQTERGLVVAYNRFPNVEYAELNSICRATGVPNDPFYSFQWHMPQINMAEAWDTSTGSGAVVAILDSGVAYENYAIPSWESTTVAPGVSSYVLAPDLAGTSFVAGYDYINNDSHPNDNNAHGTHVAGTVAQTTNNGVGVSGVAYNAAIMPVKVLNYQGSGTASALADGLHFCADNGADVANMSLSWSPGYNPGSTVSNAINYAANAGVILVAASGNDGVGTVSYPAAYSNVIAVGAVRYDSNLSYYSQYGSAQEIVAPGGDVTIDQNGDGYVDGVLQNTFVGYSSAASKADPSSFSYYFYQGTSMAAPHVAGVAALMVANGQSNIRTTLQNTAVDLGSSGWDSTYGHGLIDAEAALGGGGPGPDTTPPAPDPMSFSSAPASAGTSSISMTATTASDPSGVEYYFDCTTTGGHDSGWQSGTSYTDTGLAPGTSYTYRVKARDLSSNLNETAYSGAASATTDQQSGWVELSYDDFESGWGSYRDGGRDCRRYTGGTHSPQGAASANIQDNSGVSSSFYSASGTDIHTPGYTQLEVEFTFKAVSMENGEDFWLQYFNGSSWQTVATWTRGVNFENDNFYITTVTLDESNYTFPTNMLLRWMCDASGNRDDIYVDEIRVSAQ